MYLFLFQAYALSKALGLNFKSKNLFNKKEWTSIVSMNHISLIRSDQEATKFIIMTVMRKLTYTTMANLELDLDELCVSRPSPAFEKSQSLVKYCMA